jgi:hypothetical protein
VDEGVAGSGVKREAGEGAARPQAEEEGGGKRRRRGPPVDYASLEAQLKANRKD